MGKKGKPKEEALVQDLDVDAIALALPARSVMLDLGTSGWGAERKTDLDGVETADDKSMLRMTKMLVDSPILEEIGSLRGAVTRYVRGEALRARVAGDGMHLIPLARVKKVKARLLAFRNELAEMVERLVDVFDALVADAEQRMPGKFNRLDYPTKEQLRKAYGITWRFVWFTTPDNLAEHDTATWQEERLKAEATWNGAVFEIRDALREGFTKLVGHFAERLGNDEEGRPRRFNSKTFLPNITEFLDAFRDRNLTNDAQLEALVGKAQALLANVDTKALKETDAVRDQVRAGFEAIVKESSALITTRTRRIKFEEDAA